MLIYPRDRLAYPVGRKPSINYGHIAFKGMLGGVASPRFLSTYASPQGVLKPLNKPGVLVGQGSGGTSSFVLDPIIGPTIQFSRTVGFLNSYAMNFTTTAPTSQTFGMIFTLNTAVGATQNCGLCYDSAAPDSNSQGFAIGQSANGIVWERNSFTSSSTSAMGAPVVNTQYFVAGSVNANTQNYIMLNLSNGRYTTATISGAITFAAGSASWSMGGLSANSVSSGCNIACGYLADNVYLSASMLLEWAKDPWAFWYPYDELNNRSSTFIFETIQAPQGTLPAGAQYTDLSPAQLLADSNYRFWRSYDQAPTPSRLLAGLKPFKQDDWPVPLPPFDEGRGQWNRTYDQSMSIGRQILVKSPITGPTQDLPIPPFRPQVSADLGSTQLLATIMSPIRGPTQDLPIPPFRPEVSAYQAPQIWQLNAIKAPITGPTQDLPIPPFRPQVSSDLGSTQRLASIMAPNALRDWPLPIPPFRPQVSADLGSTVRLTQGTKPFLQTDWPLTPPPFRPQFSSDQGNASFLTITVTLPRNQYDWPLPFAPWRPQYGVIYNLANQAGQQPFSQTDWPLPIPPFRPHVSFDPSSPIWLTAAVTAPRNQYDWPLPIPFVRPQFSSDQESQALFAKPFLQTEWPLTSSVAQFNRSFDVGYTQRLASGQKPFLQTDWPLPIPAFRPDVTFMPSAPLWLAPVVTLPRNQYDWPLPVQPFRPDFNFHFYYVLGVDVIGIYHPFAQYDWQLPRQPFRPDVTFMPSAPLWLAPVFMPRNQYDWQLPITAVQPALGANYGRNYGLTSTPFNQYDWPLPVLSLPFRPQFSFEESLAVWLTKGQKPFAQTDWPLPRDYNRLPPGFYQISSVNAGGIYTPPVTTVKIEWLIRARRRGRR